MSGKPDRGERHKNLHKKAPQYFAEGLFDYQSIFISNKLPASAVAPAIAMTPCIAPAMAAVHYLAVLRPAVISRAVIGPTWVTPVNRALVIDSARITAVNRVIIAHHNGAGWAAYIYTDTHLYLCLCKLCRNG